MSMTLINFVEKDKLPTQNEIENKIRELGYNFKFLTDFDKFENLNRFDSIDCELNGQQTFVEIYLNPIEEILTDYPNLEKDLSDKNFGISFTFGGDELVSACINIISIGLIELCQSVVLYADFEEFYTREMLIEDVSKILDHDGKHIHSIPKVAKIENLRFEHKRKKDKRKNNIIDIVLWSLLIIGMILMQRKIISWYLPSLLFVIVIIKSIIEHNKKQHINGNKSLLPTPYPMKSTYPVLQI